ANGSMDGQFARCTTAMPHTGTVSSAPPLSPPSASVPTFYIRCSSSCPVESIDFGGAMKSNETDRPHGSENNRSKKPPQTFEPPTPSVKVGSRQRASIPRPAVYETAALPG